MQFGGNRAQHEAKDKEIKSIRRITDGGCGKRFSWK